MKKRYIILSMAGFTGKLRELISTAVQRKAFELGYGWLTKERNEIFHPEDAFLHFSPDVDKMPMYVSNNVSATEFYRQRGFQVQELAVITNLEDTFKMLELSVVPRVAKLTIEGVEVTVTPDDVKLDPTALLARVNKKAYEAQRQNFGE